MVYSKQCRCCAEVRMEARRKAKCTQNGQVKTISAKVSLAHLQAPQSIKAGACVACSPETSTPSLEALLGTAGDLIELPVSAIRRPLGKTRSNGAPPESSSFVTLSVALLMIFANNCMLYRPRQGSGTDGQHRRDGSQRTGVAHSWSNVTTQC